MKVQEWRGQPCIDTGGIPGGRPLGLTARGLAVACGGIIPRLKKLEVLRKSTLQSITYPNPCISAACCIIINICCCCCSIRGPAGCARNFSTSLSASIWICVQNINSIFVLCMYVRICLSLSACISICLSVCMVTCLYLVWARLLAVVLPTKLGQFKLIY